MALEVANIEQMMEWLASDSHVRSDYFEAGVLVEKLAALVFVGEPDWPDRMDRAYAYRDVLLGWLDGDGLETEFVGLTVPDADPGIFITWFMRVVGEWEAAQAVRDDTEPERTDDQHQYTEPTWNDDYGLYYRYDELNQAYEWSVDGSTDWEDQAWAEQHVEIIQGIEKMAEEILTDITAALDFSDYPEEDRIQAEEEIKDGVWNLIFEEFRAE